MLTKKHKTVRLAWAKKYRNWTSQQWNSVIWSDESRFEVCTGDQRPKVLRRKNEAFHKDCLNRKVKFPASIMVWGCMSAKGVGSLCFVDGIVNLKILKDHLLPSIEELQSNDKDYIFQQDGAPCHKSKKTMAWLKRKGLPLIDWPASSPDQSPIETLWGVMKQKLRERPARTAEDLRTRLQEIWDSFTPSDCQKLVETMPRRLNSLILAKGDVTPW